MRRFLAILLLTCLGTLGAEWSEYLNDARLQAPAAAWTLPTPLRAVAELRVPWNVEQRQNQAAELAWFRARGYNAVLAAWYEGEDWEALAAELRTARAGGWLVLLAYAGREDGLEPALPDCRRLGAVLRELLPLADAFLPTWRGTALPHWTPDRYAVALARLAHETRPHLPIVGMTYFRRKRIDLDSTGQDAAVLVLGAGVQGVIPGVVVARHKLVTDAALLTLVIGPRPYYSTVEHWGQRWTSADVRRIVERIETRSVAEGFAGSVTLAGDGLGDRWYGERFSTDSLTKSTWRQAQ